MGGFKNLISESWKKSGVLTGKISWKEYAVLSLIYLIAWFFGHTLSMGPVFSAISPTQIKRPQQINITQYLPPGAGNTLNMRDVFSQVEKRINDVSDTIRRFVKKHRMSLVIAGIFLMGLFFHVLSYQMRFFCVFICSLDEEKIDWKRHSEFADKAAGMALILLTGFVVFQIPAFYMSMKLSGLYMNSSDSMQIVSLNRSLQLLSLLANLLAVPVFFLLFPMMSLFRGSFREICQLFFDMMRRNSVTVSGYLLLKFLITSIFGVVSGFASMVFSLCTALIAGLPVLIMIVLLFFIFSFIPAAGIVLASVSASVLLTGLLVLVLFVNVFLLLRILIFLSCMDIMFIRQMQVEL